MLNADEAAVGRGGTVSLERVVGDAGRPYSRAIIAEGRLVFVSGQTPLRNGTIEGATVAEQTRATLRNLGDVLRDAGTTLANVVRCSVFLSDLDQLPAFNEAYSSAFGGELPARTAVGVTLPGYLVEIDCIAVLPST